MEAMTNPAFLLFTFLAPVLIALVKQAGWSPQANALVALACYVVVGALGAVMSGEPITLANTAALVATAGVVGTAAYQVVWSNLGTGADGTKPSLDERLTDATSVVKGDQSGPA
jgi:hypothetical protein